MRFRKLRIAWSIVGGIACVLLIALWVRSYTRSPTRGAGDRLSHYDSQHRLLRVWSLQGEILFSIAERRSGRWTMHVPQDSVLGFGAGSNDSSSSIVIPHWFAVSAAGIFAAAPWLPLRFSLRTLLIATTLVAAILGAIVYAAK
jgi:hypothetical protein